MPVLLQAEGLACGVDEAGRGPPAGPVVAAAVILDAQRPIAGLDDSKRLSVGQRLRLAGEIRRQALAWAVAEASVGEIDRLNILQASLLAMQRRAQRPGRAVPPAAFADPRRWLALSGLRRAGAGDHRR